MNMTVENALLLTLGGFVAGVINTLAGGGSLITVPLLVTLGLPGTIANATNRVGVLVQSMVGALRFRSEGVSGFRAAGPVLLPLMLGAGLGAFAVAHISDKLFERIFAVVMLLLLVPALRGTERSARGTVDSPAAWSPAVSFAAFFAIGIYGGAIQAGVGILLVLTLSRAGHDLVRSNSIKLVVVAAFTALAVAIFVLEDQVVWTPALLLAAATSLGAVAGARLAVRGGDRVIRPVLAGSVILLAGRMLGFY